MRRAAVRVRTFAAFAVGAALGAAAGAGGMLVAFPYLFPPAPAADAAPATVAGSESASFEFDRSAPGRDAIHWANGMGTLTRTDEGWVLRLEADFETGPGPNYWIYLNTRAVGEETDFVADGGRFKLAKLRSFSGAQNYLLPAALDPSSFHTVTVWCETFHVYIGSGAFRKAAAGN